MQGCFDEWMKQDPETWQGLPLLFMHVKDLICGTVTQLRATTDGLFFKGSLHDTPEGRDVRKLIEVKALESCSLKFHFTPEANPEPEYGIRKPIVKVNRISEISIVNLPGCPSALLEKAIRVKREQTWKEVEERLAKFFRWKGKLEVQRIEDLMLACWHNSYEQQMLGRDIIIQN